MTARKPVTIIVPVYGDWPSLEDCITSLKKHVKSADGHRVILVNDCGPDVELMETNIHSAIEGNVQFAYYRNDKNLGFVGTCNRAVLEIESESDNDVLLLNSDTIVTEGFIEELSSLLAEYPLLGAVSPRTNNATIATIPISEIHNKGIAHDESYKIYQTIKSMLPRYSITPVAHGFCMLIRKNCIREFGLFDPIFGKGYGEETDFCMRINAGGYVCALSNRSFVFHMEARSFSIETKNKLLEQNSKIMWQRYPFYRDAVRNYFDTGIDPVDYFAHTIASYGEQRHLIDIRGLQYVTGFDERTRIIQSVKAFSKTLDKETLYYLLDGPRPSELELLPGNTLSEKSIKGTFFLVYRPLDPTSTESLTILNRHCLKIITTLFDLDTLLESSKTSETSIRYATARHTILLSDGIVTDDQFTLLFPDQANIAVDSLSEALNLITVPLDASKLHQRWYNFIALEQSTNQTEAVTNGHKLKQKAKSALVRTPLLHKVARKVRTRLRA